MELSAIVPWGRAFDEYVRMLRSTSRTSIGASSAAAMDRLLSMPR